MKDFEKKLYKKRKILGEKIKKAIDFEENQVQQAKELRKKKKKAKDF